MNKPSRRRLVRTAILCGLIAALGTARAQEYPSKPIHIVVPYAAGATTDLLARMVAEKLREKLGQPVVVDNRSGAGGNIGADAVFRSPPDGYTLMLSAAGPLVLNKNLYPKLSYDSDAFTPVSVIATSNSALVVDPQLRISSVAELIAHAKAHPGAMTYASSGLGSTPQLAAEMFNAMAGVQVTHVPYKGSSLAMVDVLAGRVGMTFVEVGLALPQIRAGRLHVLAVGSAKRKQILPDVPAIAETLPGYVSVTWFGLVAPPKTPPRIVDRLSDAIASAFREPDVISRLNDMSIEAVGSSPEQMRTFMAQEASRWKRVIRATGMKLSD